MFILSIIMPVAFYLAKKGEISRPVVFFLISFLTNYGAFSIMGFSAFIPMVLYNPDTNGLWVVVAMIIIAISLFGISFFLTRALAREFSK